MVVIKVDPAQCSHCEVGNVTEGQFAGSGSMATDVEPKKLLVILNCTGLTSFTASLTRHVSTIADVLVAIPLVKNLYLAYTDGEPSSTSSLMQLSQAYGASDKMRVENASLVNCPCVTDDVLGAIAGLQSLRNEPLDGLDVSGHGLGRFLKILATTKIGSLALVSLEDLTKVTDHGIRMRTGNSCRDEARQAKGGEGGVQCAIVRRV
ncbi:hypothetical protein BJV82DRAFT_674530 [Fennellomyces sp. T-0311]|nr:hypothetical protein BJV82DRAFT_674530 [Fennellomyces sp. T-0311]